MKQMNKIVLILALSASAQAFGWIVRFDPNTYGKKYEILTFETVGDYRRMLEQVSIGGKVSETLLVVAPLAIETAEDLKGLSDEAKKAQEATEKKAKEEGKEAPKKESSGLVVTLADPEFKTQLSAVQTGSKLLTKVFEKGLIMGPFSYLTKEGYTIDFISSFAPSTQGNYQCKGAKQLKDHVIHPIKSNKNIFYVIYDKQTNQVLYADSGPAYGFFTFKLGEVESEGTGEEFQAGDLHKINSTGGTTCPKVYGEISMP